MSEEQLYIVGTLKAIFFQNPSNFYKVLLIKVSETNSDYLEQEIVVTGSFGDVQEDEDYRFFGHFVDHPRYGKQFLVESYERAHPTSANGLINYLSSEKFPGIGKITAEKIIEVLGEEAIDQIMERRLTSRAVQTENRIFYVFRKLCFCMLVSQALRIKLFKITKQLKLFCKK